jgi:biotin carboxyl carrier protein
VINISNLKDWWFFKMKRYNITVNGKAYDVAVEEVGGSAAAAPVAAAPVAAAPAAPAPAAAPVADGTKVTAPMPGTILDIKVAVGDTVKSGQAICVLEAMKMENDVNAPCDGKVLSVNTTKGSAVETGAVLAVIG